jgi:hypothetical protein
MTDRNISAGKGKPNMPFCIFFVGRVIRLAGPALFFWPSALGRYTAKDNMNLEVNEQL